MDLQLLHKIDEELGKSDVAALKFLCTDCVPKKRLETVKDGKDLFLQLNELALLDDKFFLAELLYTIGCNDLLRLLGTNKREVETRLQNLTDSQTGISSYRKMLYKLSEDITEENLRTIKFLLDTLPKTKLQSATFLDILSEMEKMEMLEEDKLDELVKILDQCDKPLANRVKEFRNFRQDYSSVSSISIDNETQTPSTEGVFSDAKQATPTKDDQEKEKNYYPLTRRPRGYCLIINNFNFENARPLTDRRGTDKDAAELTKIFKKLHFKVNESKDLSSSDMRTVTMELAQKNHSELDAFVCCILSHGQKGTVLGTDGKEVLIHELTLPFARCKTLLEKPKLFFIQACQGSQKQRPMYIQGDGDEESNMDKYEEDAQSVAFRTIPVEADFLIGMATVESYQSFRHTIKGSIFIQELCRQIENGLQSKEDILSILTSVNREVSMKALGCYKQMPEPRYTLTKKLVFTLD